MGGVIPRLFVIHDEPIYLCFIIVETIGKRNSCTIVTHFLKQREALNTALSIGVRQVETMRTLLTKSLAVFMPFNVQELNDATGNYYGINQISKDTDIYRLYNTNIHEKIAEK